MILGVCHGIGSRVAHCVARIGYIEVTFHHVTNIVRMLDRVYLIELVIDEHALLD